MTDHTGREQAGTSSGVGLRGWDAERVRVALGTSADEAREMLALVRSLRLALDRGRTDEARDINDTIYTLADHLGQRLGSVLRAGRNEAVRRLILPVDPEDS